MKAPEIQEYKTLPKYDELWTVLGLFLPMPMGCAKYTPEYVIAGWGLVSTIAISKYKIPIGWFMILIAIIF